MSDAKNQEFSEVKHRLAKVAELIEHHLRFGFFNGGASVGMVEFKPGKHDALREEAKTLVAQAERLRSEIDAINGAERPPAQLAAD